MSKIISILFFVITVTPVFSQTEYLSPEQLIFNSEKNEIYIALKTANKIGVFDTKTNQISNEFQIEGTPNSIFLNKAEQTLVVASGIGEGLISVINLNRNKTETRIKAGHSPFSPIVLSNSLVVVCDRFAGKVHLIDLKQKKIVKSLNVAREPITAIYDKEHDQIVVAHHLPDDAATDSIVSAKITFIDALNFEITKQISMPNGSGSIKQIVATIDNKFAVITHILSRYTVHTTQLEQGWQNTNAFSVVNLDKQEMFHTVLLDDVQHGAANPWAVCFTENDEKLLITHAGTNELSIIDFPGLIKKLENFSTEEGHYYNYDDPSNKLSFLHGLRNRIPLKGKGPRGIAVDKNNIFISHYFSDALEIIDQKSHTSELFPITNQNKMDLARKGEYLFYSAEMCFENWQSCSSCHPDSRVDGFNWDLLNDGIGNPKNVLSLLYSHKTPPAMSTGIRPKAETAVRAGLKFIQFMEHDENDAEAIDAYLKTLKPFLSPYLIDGKLSKNAKAGKKIFEQTGCTDCHPAPLFTSMEKYDVGTTSQFDKTRDENGKIIPQTEFDTPTLIETWRTAPYLHDGRYKSLEDLFIKGKHGLPNSDMKLSEHELMNLIEYVKSL